MASECEPATLAAAAGCPRRASSCLASPGRVAFMSGAAAGQVGVRPPSPKSSHMMQSKCNRCCGPPNCRTRRPHHCKLALPLPLPPGFRPYCCRSCRSQAVQQARDSRPCKRIGDACGGAGESVRWHQAAAGSGWHLTHQAQQPAAPGESFKYPHGAVACPAPRCRSLCLCLAACSPTPTASGASACQATQQDGTATPRYSGKGACLCMEGTARVVSGW